MHSARVVDSIRELPIAEWSAIARAHPYTYSPEFLATLESSNNSDSRHRYWILYDPNQRIVAITHFSVVTTDLAVFASGWLRMALARVRRIFPRFLKARLLECALPIVPPSSGEQEELLTYRNTVEILGATLVGIARENGILAIVIGAIEPHQNSTVTDLQKIGFQFVPCLPVAHLDIAWETHDAYLSSLKSYYRCKALRHLRINRINGIRHELRDEFHELADVLWQQWLVVREGASEYDGESLTPDFFREFSSRFGVRSKVLLFHSSDHLVGHALLLHDGDTLYWRSFGRTKAQNDSLYIYACHTIVETAIALGVKRLDLGVTTYAIKRDLGSSITPRQIAVRLSFGLINRHVARLYSLINHVPEIKGRSVYKSNRHTSAS